MNKDELIKEMSKHLTRRIIILADIEAKIDAWFWKMILKVKR